MVVFAISETVTAFDGWIASNIEGFHNGFPHKASLKYFYDCCSSDVSRHAADIFFHSALDVKDSLGHPFTICTRSRTVQKVFVLS
jgi:hypothetical protein